MKDFPFYIIWLSSQKFQISPAVRHLEKRLRRRASRPVGADPLDELDGELLLYIYIYIVYVYTYIYIYIYTYVHLHIMYNNDNNNTYVYTYIYIYIYIYNIQYNILQYPRARPRASPANAPVRGGGAPTLGDDTKHHSLITANSCDCR